MFLMKIFGGNEPVFEAKEGKRLQGGGKYYFLCS